MTDILSTDEIAAMRTEAAIYLPETGVIKSDTGVSDGMGGFTDVESAGASVACRIDPPGRNIAITQYADRIGERQLVVIVMPAGTVFVEGNQITISGVTYEALAVLSGSWEITRNVLCVRQG